MEMRNFCIEGIKIKGNKEDIAFIILARSPVTSEKLDKEMKNWSHKKKQDGGHGLASFGILKIWWILRMHCILGLCFSENPWHS